MGVEKRGKIISYGKRGIDIIFGSKYRPPWFSIEFIGSTYYVRIPLIY
jgi:hypothetical protein